MTLIEFMARERCGYEALARRAGMSRGDLHNLAHGIRGFSVRTGLKIKLATNGAVTLDDLAEPFRRASESSSPEAAA